MTITRRSILAGGVGAIAIPLVARSARAAEFTLLYGSNRQTTHPTEVEMVEVIRRIKEETNGRVEIRHFPNSQLGSDADMLHQLRVGALHFLSLSSTLLSPLCPAAAITGVGFAFNDYSAVWNAMDGELGQLVRQEIDKFGLHVFNKMWDSGFRQTTTLSRPIISVSDLANLKIRVPAATMWVSLFNALGARPTSVSAADLYVSLQTHLVDAQENPLPIIDSFRIYEVQKYCSLTNHMWDGFWNLANKRAWDRLPEDVREIVTKNWNLGADNERKANLDVTNRLRSELERKGLIFTDARMETFRAKLREAGFYNEWRSKFGDELWTTLEKYTGSLTT